MFSKRIFLGVLFAVTAGCVPNAVALNVDFDADLIQVQQYLGNLVTLRNVDGDGNGLKEDDQLGMLSQLLAGGAPVASIDATRRSELEAAYTFNFNEVINHVTVNISGVGTVNLLDELQTSNAALGNSLRRLIAGILTIADDSTIDYLNAIADQIVVKLLTGTPQSGEITNVQNQITFLAETYETYGDAGDEPNYLGASGDIDEDTVTNLDEFLTLAIKSRENWLTENEIGIALRFVSLTGGGTKITGVSLDFVVTTAGESGEVSYQWYKGTPGSGTPVGDTATFNIPFANTSDAGTYYVVISDGAYTRTSPTLSLSVTLVPIFITQQISGGVRVIGGSKTFTVGVQGGQPGPYTYIWKKGVDVLPVTTASWTIPELAQTDSGQYSVTVSSNGGADSITSGPTTLTVTIPATLTIATQPANVSKQIGTSHTFTILAVGGSGTYSYVWRKGGVPIPDAPNQNSYTIPVVLGGDAGIYSCVVDDTVQLTTKTSQNATLIVTGGIVINTQPKGATIGLGANYTISVDATGASGIFNYEWRKGGEAFGAPNLSSYTISNATEDAAGDYTCYITDANNVLIDQLSNTATVTVNVGGLAMTQQPAGGIFFLGDTVLLYATATGGSSDYDYDWRKDNISLGAANASTLVLSDVDLNDTGEYRCQISDGVQVGVKVLSDIAVVEVVDSTPLQVTEQPLGGYAYSGEPVTFGIVVSGGSGEYDYAWTRGGDPVCECNESSFTIGSLTVADAGEYQCIVSDKLYPQIQIISDSAALEVGDAIQFTENPVGISVDAGENVVLTCAATGGIGELFYFWELDGEFISNVPNLPTLDLKAARLSEAGEYKCAVSDNYTVARSLGAQVDVLLVDVPEELQSYNTILTGSKAVPPNPTEATGRIFGSLLRLSSDPADGATLLYTTVQLVSGADQLLLFAGEDDKNGEVMINFGPAQLTQSGSVQLTEEEASIVFAGYAYFGITSSTYPDSEIRGQISAAFVEPAETHAADQDGDFAISLSELLRLIQFYNTGSLSCSLDSEDGYAPGPGDQSCSPHSSDYQPQNWIVALSELLRSIQFYNSGGFEPCETGEDGFCPTFAG